MGGESVRRNELTKLMMTFTEEYLVGLSSVRTLQVAFHAENILSVVYVCSLVEKRKAIS
jgi:hypothetical protein